MNTKTTFPFIAIIAIFMFSGYSCNHEQKTTTIINSDGSCERTVFVKSVEDTSSSFPAPTDKSWNIRAEGDSGKVYVASKRFDDVNKMNNDYRDTNKVGIDIKFEKKFRWFYTYFDYQETYKSYFPFKKIALDSFLTKEEYAQYEKGDTSKALEERMYEFVINRNAWEEFYGQVIDSVKSLNDPSLPVNVFLSKKKEFINWLTDNPEGSKGILHINNYKDYVMLEKIMGVKFRGKLERQIDNIEKSIDAKFEFMLGVDGKYINEVSMPGIILNTNASTIEGNKVSWKLDVDNLMSSFCFTDYTMTVESRIANPWATYATGGLLIVIVGLLILPRLRRK
jgi:hypothetical protein